MTSSSSILKVLITGGNSGIGFELAKQMLVGGHDVLIACRDMKRANAAAEQLEKATQQQGRLGVVQCDLADFSSVRQCAAELKKKWDHLDVLVCNAAIITQQQETTKDGLDTMFQVNHVGHCLLTQLLMPWLAKSTHGRIVMLASELHRRVQPPLDQPGVLYPTSKLTPWKGMSIYPHVKLLNVWAVQQFAKQLPSNVTINAVCPGFAPTTGLGRHVQGTIGGLMMKYILPLFPFTVTPAEGASRVAKVCLLPAEPRINGQYFSKGVQVPCSAAGADEVRAQQLWELTEQALAQTSAAEPIQVAVGAAAAQSKA